MTEADIVMALTGGDFTEEEIQIRCDLSQDDIEQIMEAHNCEVCADCKMWANCDDMDDARVCEDCQSV